MTPFEWFDHTADLGLRVTAADLDGLFAEAARALFAAIVEDHPETRNTKRIEFAIEGTRTDWLLADWLSELLHHFESKREFLSNFEVALTKKGIQASAQAQPFVPHPERAAREIKAVTYHGLKVERATNGWLAEVIVDI